MKLGDFKYSIGARIKDETERRLKVPGPGTYDSLADVKFASTQSNRFPGSKRAGMDNPALKNMPGPGAHSPDYTAAKSKSPRFTVGTSKRSNPSMLTKTPGAGTYELKPMVGNEGRSVSMHSKIQFSPEKKEKANVPGPGNYSPDGTKVKKSEPAYRLGSSTRQDLGEKVR